jgi:carbon-monoxide dehydrogenase medium subunit
LAHNDASAEYPLLGALLEMEVVLQGPNGRRTLAFDDFSLSHFTTAREADELVVEVRVPTRAPDVGWAFQEVARRHGDFGLVSCGALVTMDGDVVEEVRLALGGVGATALRAPDAELLLRGQALNEDSIRAAADSVAEMVSPPSDMHGSADFRRHLCRVLVARCLKEAHAHA